MKIACKNVRECTKYLIAYMHHIWCWVKWVSLSITKYNISIILLRDHFKAVHQLFLNHVKRHLYGTFLLLCIFYGIRFAWMQLSKFILGNMREHLIKTMPYHGVYSRMLFHCSVLTCQLCSIDVDFLLLHKFSKKNAIFAKSKSRLSLSLL